MAEAAAVTDEREWVPLRVAVARLGMSANWLRTYAQAEGVEIRVGNGNPMVDWTAVEAWIARSRIGPSGRGGC